MQLSDTAGGPWHDHAGRGSQWETGNEKLGNLLSFVTASLRRPSKLSFYNQSTAVAVLDCRCISRSSVEWWLVFWIFWILNKCTNGAVVAVSIPGSPSHSLKLTAHGGKTDGQFLQLKRIYAVSEMTTREKRTRYNWVFVIPIIYTWAASLVVLDWTSSTSASLIKTNKQKCSSRCWSCMCDRASTWHTPNGGKWVCGPWLMHEIPVASAARRSSWNNVHATELQKLKWLTLNFLILHIYLQSVRFITLQFVYPSN